MISSQLSFAVSLKQALERTGVFSVHPFTTADAALDYLSEHPQEVALIDFDLPGIDGESLVEHLRAIQPDLALIVSPTQPGDIVARLRLQDTLNAPFNARDIIPRLRRAAANRPHITMDDETPHSAGRETDVLPHQAQTDRLRMPDTARLPETESHESGESTPPLDLPEFSSLDTVLRDNAPAAPPEKKPGAKPNDPFHELVQSMRGQDERKPLTERTHSLLDFTLPTDPERTRAMSARTQPTESDDRFRQLAAEEPPMPTLEESGTVGDLMTGIGDSGFRKVLAILRGETPPPEKPENRQTRSLSSEELEDAIEAFYSAETEAEPAPKPETPEREADPFRDFEGEADEPDEPTPAKLILETALDESTPPESFSLADLIMSIERKLPEHRPNVQPLPSWLRDFEPLIFEPDFLPPDMPPELAPAESSSEFVDYTTRPHIPAAPEPADFDTESMMLEVERTQPVGLPEFPQAPEAEPEPTAEAEPLPTAELEAEFSGATEAERTEAAEPETADTWEAWEENWPDAAPGRRISLEDYELESELFDTAFDRFASFEVIENEEDTPSLGMAPVEDPRIAQLALGLTQLSLETTAEASLLTRGGEIVGYAGELTKEDLNELRAAIDDDWDTEIEEARIRFITLSGGREYMLYSRQTEEALTLTMIFAGATPLRDIRRQGKRLIEALRDVPESTAPAPERPEAPPPPVWEMPRVSAPPEAPAAAEAVPAPAPAAIVPVDTAPLVAYACAWILRDPRARLNEMTAQAMMAGLRTQLNERGWRVRTVHAQDEFVYLLADVPESVPTKDIIRDLKRRSAEIARALEPKTRPDTLWADAYLMVTPGRELEMDEIQQFISFERM